MYAVADQMNVLDALHKLTSNRSLVFGPGNYDQEFIGCLCYCLLQLTEDPNSRYVCWVHRIDVKNVKIMAKCMKQLNKMGTKHQACVRLMLEQSDMF